MAETAPAPAHPGLILGVARFFYDPRGSMRGVLESRPSEARLLAYLMIACALLLSRQIVHVSAARGLGADPTGVVMNHIVSTMFLLPLVYYGLAALGTRIARAFGGVGGWQTGRAAFFWAALVSAPVILLTSLLPLILADWPEAALIAIAQAGPVFFAWALAQCYAEAFGFTRSWAVMAVLSAPILAIVGVVFVLRMT